MSDWGSKKSSNKKPDEDEDEYENEESKLDNNSLENEVDLNI